MRHALRLTTPPRVRLLCRILCCFFGPYTSLWFPHSVGNGLSEIGIPHLQVVGLGHAG